MLMMKSIKDNYRIYDVIIVKIAKKLLVLDYGFQTPFLNHLTMLSHKCKYFFKFNFFSVTFFFKYMYVKYILT